MASSDQHLQGFQDGVYRLQGFRLTMGQYKSGQHKGKPMGKFLYHLLDDRYRDEQGRHALVSQNLGWFPGWSVFEVNFKAISGMTREEFNEVAAQRGATSGSQRVALFNDLFSKAEYDAEVAASEFNGRIYLNVFKIVGMVTAAVQIPQIPRPQQSSGGPAPGSVEFEINQLVRALDLHGDDLHVLLMEEFGVMSAHDLDAENRVLLLDLLRDMHRQRQ